VWCSARPISIGRALGGVKTLGVTAGASAPRGCWSRKFLDAFATRYTLNVETVSGADESGMFFPLPRQLRDNAGRLIIFCSP
jgi:4-hydroxy-3-methylbut-2-enyl diphosphate reductase